MRKRLLLLSGGLIFIAFVIEGFFIMDYLKKDHGIEVYQTTATIKEGQKISLDDVETIVLNAHGMNKIQYCQSNVIGRVAPKTYLPGALLIENDFNQALLANEDLTMVISMTEEEAHSYEIHPGETIGAMVFRNGQIEYLENLIMKKITYPNGQGEGLEQAVCLMTISGHEDVLKKLFEASLTGNLRVVKK